MFYEGEMLKLREGNSCKFRKVVNGVGLLQCEEQFYILKKLNNWHQNLSQCLWPLQNTNTVEEESLPETFLTAFSGIGTRIIWKELSAKNVMERALDLEATRSRLDPDSTIN